MMMMTVSTLSSRPSMSIGWLCLLLSSVDAFILPFPTNIGHELAFDLQVRLPYTMALPKYTGGRGRRAVSMDAGPSGEEGRSLAKLNSIFVWMKLGDVECQKRLLCQIGQNPNKYSPLSNIILQQLQPMKFVDRMNVTSTSRLQLKEFYTAWQRGNSPVTDCHTDQCQSDPDKSINWDIMKAFRTKQRFVNLKFL